MKAVMLVTALLFALAGCLGVDEGRYHPDDGRHDDHPDAGNGTLPITGAEDLVIEVTGGHPSEFSFSPERIDVQEGQRVGIVFTNAGGMDHEFSIKTVGFHLHAESGENASGAFIAPQWGEYIFGCYIPGHFEMGMRGTLVVA